VAFSAWVNLNDVAIAATRFAMSPMCFAIIVPR
jgi:hypothetical protein